MAKGLWVVFGRRGSDFFRWRGGSVVIGPPEGWHFEDKDSGGRSSSEFVFSSSDCRRVTGRGKTKGVSLVLAASWTFLLRYPLPFSVIFLGGSV
jgi:hypothetical protein